MIGENYYYKNSLTRKGVLLDAEGNAKDYNGKPLNIKEAFNRQYKNYKTIMECRSNLEWFEKYKNKKEVLSESQRRMGKMVVPSTYDHLKWKLDDFQILELDRFVHYPLDYISERDMSNMSKFLNIPEKNLISIHNTYSPKDRKYMSFDEFEQETMPNASKGFSISSKDAGLDVNNMNKLPSFNGKGKSIQNYQTPYEKRYNDSNFRMERTDKTPESLLAYPRMDEFLMMYLSVDFKPISLEVSTTKKIIMSMNPEESGHELYESVSESLDQFNDVYGTKYFFNGSFIKEGEEKIIIDVEYRSAPKKSKNPQHAVKDPDAEMKQKMKNRAIDTLMINHHNRIHNKGHWDKNSSKIMDQFMAGELGYADPF
jgi:hypothetical protein